MEALKDPRGDRQVKDIKPPPHRPLDEKLLFPGTSNLPDWKLLREHLSKEGPVSKKHVLRIINDAIAIFKTEPNLVKIKDPVMVVGDMHGQFYDFLQIISLKEKREEKAKIEMKFLFLGDYVDRGNFGIELLLLLYSLKVTSHDLDQFSASDFSTKRQPRVSTHDPVFQLQGRVPVQVRSGRLQCVH